MIRLRLSAIHLPMNRLWNSALSRPRRARQTTSSGQALTWRSFGRAHPGLKALGFPAGDFTINQQAKPFGVAEICGGVPHPQFGKGFGRPVKPQGLQVIEGWVAKHCVSLQWA